MCILRIPRLKSLVRIMITEVYRGLKREEREEKKFLED